MEKNDVILSVITISYNDLEGLTRTVESVGNQSYKEFDYVVIDGGSTDGSKDYLEKNKDHFSFYCSEKDKGIYDAQNKGIKNSKGKYLLFLNAGDTFYSADVVEKFVAFEKQHDRGIIYGNTNLINERGQELLIQPDKLDLEFWYMKTLNHQAAFIQRQLFERLGLYDLKYRICADFELFVKAFVDDPSQFVHFNEVVCNYDQFGFSSTKENFQKMMNEHQEILENSLTPEQYKRIKAAYIKTLPAKGRFWAYVGEYPLLNSAFKRMFGAYKRIRTSGKK